MRNNKQKKYFNISKQIGISYFFNFLIILLQPLLVALLTRVLSIEEYGVYSLLFITVSTLSVFFRFGFAIYIKNKIPGLKENVRARTIVTLLSMSFVLLILIGGFLYLLKDMIISFLGISSYSNLFLISILLIITISFYEIIDSYLISIKKIFIESFLMFLIKCLWIIILVLVFFAVGTISLNTIFIFWAATVIFCLLLVLLVIRKEVFGFFRNKQTLDLSKAKHALKFSLPLIFLTSFVWIISSSDRYIINYYLGKSDVAIYSLAYSIVSIIISVPVIFQNIIHPYFAEQWNLHKDASLLFNVMLKYTLMLVIPSIIGMFVLRSEIISLISGPKYYTAAPVMTILLIFPLFATLIEIFNKTLFLREMIKQVIFIYLIAAVVNFVLNITLVPVFGIYAAAFSAVIAYFLVFVIMVFYRPSNIKLNLDYLRILRIIIAAILMGLIIYPIGPSQYWSKILVVALGVLVYTIFLVVFKVFTKEEKSLLYFAYSRLKKPYS